MDSKWILLHKNAWRRMWIGIKKAPFASAMHIFSLSFMLFVPLMLLLLLQGMQVVGQGWKHDVSISLYVEQSNIANIDTMLAKLQANSAVQKVTHITAAQGLQDLQKSLGMQNLSQALPANPLPDVLQVYPIKSMRSSAQMQQLANGFKVMAGVQEVQVDTTWVQRLNALTTFARRIGTALVVLLFLGIVGLLVNQNRIALLKSMNDLRVLHLVGAPRQFMRRPLLYRSALYGLVAAVVACGLAFVCARWLDIPLNNFLQTYNQTIYNPIGLHWRATLDLIAGVVIGAVVATFIISTYHLRQLTK